MMRALTVRTRVGGTGVLQRLKRLAGRTDDPGPEYVCQACGTAFEAQRQVCSACGGYHIERRDW
jgi:rubrerythrin